MGSLRAALLSQSSANPLNKFDVERGTDSSRSRKAAGGRPVEEVLPPHAVWAVGDSDLWNTSRDDVLKVPKVCGSIISPCTARRAELTDRCQRGA